MSRDAGRERLGDASAIKAAAAPRLFTKYVAGLTARSRVGATPPECRRLLEVADGLGPIQVSGALMSSSAILAHSEGWSTERRSDTPLAKGDAERRHAAEAGFREDVPQDLADLDLVDLGLDDLDLDRIEEVTAGRPPIWEMEGVGAEAVEDAGAEAHDDAPGPASDVSSQQTRVNNAPRPMDTQAEASAKASEAATTQPKAAARSSRASKLFMLATVATGLSVTALVVSVQEANTPVAPVVQAAAESPREAAVLVGEPSQVKPFGVMAALRKAAVGRQDVNVLLSLELDETGRAAVVSGEPVTGFAGFATFEAENGCRQRRQVAFEAAPDAPSGFLAAMGPVINEVCGGDAGAAPPAQTSAAPSPAVAMPLGPVPAAVGGAVVADAAPSFAATPAPVETEALSALALADGSLSNAALTDLLSRRPVRCVVSGDAPDACAERTVYTPDGRRFTIVRPLEDGGQLEMRGDYEVRDGALCHQSVGLSVEASGGGMSRDEALLTALREEAAFAVAAGRALCHRFTPKPALGEADLFGAEAFVDGAPAPALTDPRPFRMRPREVIAAADS